MQLNGIQLKATFGTDYFSHNGLDAYRGETNVTQFENSNYNQAFAMKKIGQTGETYRTPQELIKGDAMESNGLLKNNPNTQGKLNLIG